LTKPHRRLLSAALLVGVLSLTIRPALRSAASWLVVDDPLQTARSIVVLGGHLPFRAIEAAHIYQQGWAREIWVTKGDVAEEDLALARLGIDRPIEAVYSRLVVERLGVPAGAIRMLPDQPVNTAEELRAIAREIGRVGGGRVILVTSKYHARRVRVLWRNLIGTDPQAIVRYTPDDPFEPDRWWRRTADALAVSREWFGLLNASIGFPVKSGPG
jgi:uncharacterized SAM-binding protein YcdF (DUF218 family)